MFNRHVNAAIDCRLEFGAYYQVHNCLHSNAVEIPRTIGAIGIGQSNDGSGTCTFLGLHNLRIFKANTFQLLPTPQEVITILTDIAAADKIKITKDPIFQISALQSPPLDDSPIRLVRLPSSQPTTTIRTSPCKTLHTPIGHRPHLPVHIAPTICHYPHTSLRQRQIVGAIPQNKLTIGKSRKSTTTPTNPLYRMSAMHR
jgi:hypothetical protein